MNLHRTHLNIENKLLVVSSVPSGIPTEPMGWAQDRCGLHCVSLKISYVYSTPKPTDKFHMLFVISFQSFNTDAKCSNQIRILPNNRAQWEVRWKRDGLLTVRRTGN